MWSRTLFAARSVNTSMTRRMMSYQKENGAADASIGNAVAIVGILTTLSVVGIIPLKKLYGK